MSYALPIFIAVAASFAAAGIFTFVLQFFADGWQLPIREKLAVLPVEKREQRKRQIPIVFAVCFITMIMFFTFACYIGTTP